MKRYIICNMPLTIERSPADCHKIYKPLKITRSSSNESNNIKQLFLIKFRKSYSDPLI
jgi:hypothetical protein